MTTVSTSELDKATADVDAAWAEHSSVRDPLTVDVRAIVDRLQGTTGLQLNPGAEKLIDAFLDYAETQAENLTKAAEANTKAMVAQGLRDDALAAQPEPEAPAATPSLLTNEPSDTRNWLRTANDNDVRDALNEILDRDKQVEWAAQLLKWARADGTTAQVLTAINSVLTPKDVIAAPTGQVPPTASADDVPTQPAGAVPVELDDIIAWIGDDAARAHAAFDKEIGADSPRPDVLAKLTDIIDANTPGPVNAPPEENAAPENTPAEPREPIEPETKP